MRRLQDVARAPADKLKLLYAGRQLNNAEIVSDSNVMGETGAKDAECVAWRWWRASLTAIFACFPLLSLAAAAILVVATGLDGDRVRNDLAGGAGGEAKEEKAEEVAAAAGTSMVTFRLLAGGTYPLDVANTDTIATVKARLAVRVRSAIRVKIPVVCG